MEGYEDDISLSPSTPHNERNEFKEDPSGGTASQAEAQDDDVYEDSHDLDTSQQHQRMMLVRLPEYLMAKIKENGEDLSGADLGKVLIPQGPGADPKKLRVLLNPQIEVLRPLPHRYDMNVMNSEVENVYVMREQDVKRKRSEQDGGGFRRAKKTALVGHAVNDCTLTADMTDPNYSYVLLQRKLMELPQADRQTILLDSMAGVGGAKYGATLRSQKDAWRKPIQKRILARQSAEGKAVRMPRNELLDILFRTFEEQPYWSMRQLRERTHQPEVYLRSVLDSIARLQKRGPYALKYALKEEYKLLQIEGASVESLVEKAPTGPELSDTEVNNTGENPEEHDSDDMEMENVELV